MFFTILWHLHQPIYRHPLSGKFILPYVNFHLTKNYYQMAYLVEEQAFQCNFNFVPCLLEQIEIYAQGQADDFLESSFKKKPDDLTAEDLTRLNRFLSKDEIIDNKSEYQLRALQSFFSPLLQPEIMKIKDKDVLFERKQQIQKKVIPLYKKLYLNGQIELTTSAYYHPLLPLIVDISIAEETLKPSISFRYPEDAAVQIEKGRRYFKQIFGQEPTGFWPSEGGVSLEVAKIISRSNYSYLITDENILWKSLKRTPDFSLLGRPYYCQGLIVFFRDRELSDLISFEYQHWETKTAVDHFIEKIRQRMVYLEEDSLLVVALDGENPWAGYPENGVSFLRELYSRLKLTPGLEPVKISDYLKIMPSVQEIELVPGTWLGNFSRWIGHPAKNAAWEKLAMVRKESGQNEAILIAEGSDWFWWFGEANVEEFEILFDSYLEYARSLATQGISHA
ncbi:MAG: glycoside hydrolase family 57 protein [Candidatus Aminicenantes bacterium]|nr:glycoside hydrolase family 57 protein [Candidatus Aminicenantes bacterium]